MMGPDGTRGKCAIIISDSSVPGEGEHKIMEFIRKQRENDNYDPNTSHCICGQDADLLMLSLALHESRVTILREEVVLTRKRTTTAQTFLTMPMQLLHIARVRSYIDQSLFSSLKGALPFGYNLDRCVDDLVMLCFLSGNDFLPHLPSLSIRDGALDMIFQIYKKILPQMGGYMTQNAIINLERLEQLMCVIGGFESIIFQEKEKNEQRMRKYRIKASKARYLPDVNAELTEASFKVLKEALLLEQSNTLVQTQKKEIGSVSPIDPQTSGWQERYIDSKRRVLSAAGLNAGSSVASLRRSLVVSFVRGMQWVLLYYYKGVASWSWYYEHHHAPLACDFKNLSSIKCEFSLGKPFTPMAQLMSVLPPFSAHCVPEACRNEMRDPKSELADFYPSLTGAKAFKLDPNGKPPAVRWLWIALLPFIDEKRLLTKLDTLCATFTDDEKRRNTNKTASELILSQRHPIADIPTSKDWQPLPSPLFGYARKVRDGPVCTLEYRYEKTRTTPPVILATRGTSSPCAELENGFSEVMRVKRGGTTRTRYPVPPIVIENALRRLAVHDTEVVACKFFSRGYCKFGAKCKFSHLP